MKKLLVGLAAGALVLACPAVAQTVTETVANNKIDITPITTQLIHIAGTVLAGIAIWIGVWVKSFLATKTSLADSQFAESMQARYNEAVARGMAYAETKAQAMVPQGGKIKIDNEFVREAAQYVIDLWPDLTKNMNFDGVAKSIVARLPTGTFTATAEAIANKQMAPEPAKVEVAPSVAAVAPAPVVEKTSTKV